MGKGNGKNKKTRKAQVVVMAREFGQWWVLILQVNKKRGEFWQNVTGGVDSDESFADGALRELKEETHLKAKEIHDLNCESHFENRHGDLVHEKAFLAIFHRPVAPSISQEHQNFRWKQLHTVGPEDFGFSSNYDAFYLAKKFLTSRFK